MDEILVRLNRKNLRQNFQFSNHFSSLSEYHLQQEQYQFDDLKLFLHSIRKVWLNREKGSLEKYFISFYFLSFFEK